MFLIQDGRASTGRGGTNGRDEEDWNEEERERKETAGLTETRLSS